MSEPSGRPTVHVKKCHPGAFQAVRSGEKTFEWRQEDDCKYEVGDVLLLLEFDPGGEVIATKWRPGPTYLDEGETFEDLSPPRYTGEVERRRITYVLRDKFGIPPGYAILSLEKVAQARPWEPMGCIK